MLREFPHCARFPIRSLLVGGSVFALAATFPNVSFCIVHRVFGVPCPVCGATRAVIALSHLSLLESFRWNPGLWFGAAAFIGTLIVLGKTPKKIIRASHVAWGAIFVTGILRIIMIIQFPNTQFIHASF